ncbi:hypothetical protein C0J52_25402, partial [Blattella germanica]
SEKNPEPIFSHVKSSNLLRAATACRKAWHEDPVMRECFAIGEGPSIIGCCIGGGTGVIKSPLHSRVSQPELQPEGQARQLIILMSTASSTWNMVSCTLGNISRWHKYPSTQQRKDRIKSKEDRKFLRLMKETIEIAKHSQNINRDDEYKLSNTWRRLLNIEHKVTHPKITTEAPIQRSPQPKAQTTHLHTEWFFKS